MQIKGSNINTHENKNKKLIRPKVGKTMDQVEPSHTAGKNIKWYYHSGELFPSLL